VDLPAFEEAQANF